MESCTSGLIASMITDTEGASAVFPGGYVTYLNKTKILCGVDEKIIKEHGVYSKQCARAMAETAQKNLHTEIAVGITGTTGNVDPNNADSMQGKVFFCILVGENAYDYEYNALSYSKILILMTSFRFRVRNSVRIPFWIHSSTARSTAWFKGMSVA